MNRGVWIKLLAALAALAAAVGAWLVVIQVLRDTI